MGQNPTDEEVFQMLSQVDDDGSGSIEFPEFLKVIEAQKEASAAQNDESDLIDAFVAMGGLTDKSGHVEAEKLRRTIKAFELTVDIDRLIEETDTDGSGEIDYDEFKGTALSPPTHLVASYPFLEKLFYPPVHHILPLLRHLHLSFVSLGMSKCDHILHPHVF